MAATHGTAPSAQDRLVSATQELLWERGYTGTSPKAIQSRSGVGQGSMYHHFASKADLALAAENRTIEQLRAANEDRLGGSGRAADRLVTYLRHTAGGPLAGCPVGRLAYDPDIVADPQLRMPLAESMEWTMGELSRVIAEAQADGDLAADHDPAVLAQTMMATRQGAYVLARTTGEPARFDEAIDGLLRVLGLTI